MKAEQKHRNNKFPEVTTQSQLNGEIHENELPCIRDTMIKQPEPKTVYKI